MKLTGTKFSDKKTSVWLHDIRFVFEKNGWIFIVGLIVFMILIPFFTAGLPGSSIFDVEVTHDQLKFRLIHQDVITVVLGAAVVMGMVTGASLFHFVQQKRDTTIFFSMGITRSRLFMHRIIVGFIMLAVMIFIPMAVSVALNIKAVGIYQCLIRNAIFTGTGIFLTAAVSYMISVIMCLFSGSLTELVLYWSCAMAAPVILCYGLNLLMKKLYWGNAWGMVAYSGAEKIKESLLEYLSIIDPLIFFKEQLEIHSQFMRPIGNEVPEAVSWWIIIIWAIFLVMLTVLGLILLIKWKAENAGIAGTGKAVSQIASALTGFLTFVLVFTYLYDFNQGFGAVFGIAAFLAVNLFWNKTGLFGYISMKERAIWLSGQAAVIAVACLVFATGFFGGTNRFLDDTNALEVKISYTGNPSLLYEKASGSSTGRGYYITSNLTLSDEESVKKAEELHKNFDSSGRQSLATGEKTEETVIPYDISFSYTQENGKTRTWYYDRASFEQLEQMLALEELEEVRTGQSTIFRGSLDGDEIILSRQAYAAGTIFITDELMSNTYEISLGEEERVQLLGAIEKDISEMSVEERYFSEDKSKAVLMFTMAGEEDSRYFTYHLDNAFVYVTSNYRNTIKWLEDNQLLEYVSDQPEIEAIYLQRMDPYIGMNDPEYPMGMYFMSYCADSTDEFLIQKDFGKIYEITDEKEVKEIAAVLQNGYYMSRGGFLAAVKLKGEERYRYMFLPQSCVPSFIRG